MKLIAKDYFEFIDAIRETNQVNIFETPRLLRKLYATLDRKWRETCAIIFYYFDSRKNQVDIDWLNMHNDMRFNEKKHWEHRTKTYLEETKHLEKWTKK